MRVAYAARLEIVYSEKSESKVRILPVAYGVLGEWFNPSGLNPEDRATDSRVRITHTPFCRLDRVAYCTRPESGKARKSGFVRLNRTDGVCIRADGRQEVSKTSLSGFDLRSAPVVADRHPLDVVQPCGCALETRQKGLLQRFAKPPRGKFLRRESESPRFRYKLP